MTDVARLSVEWTQLFSNLIWFLFYGQFAQSFWPSFISTVLGIVLGLPFALWTNRQLAAHSERLRHKEEQQRLVVALQLLRQTLGSNRSRLRNLVKVLEDNRAPFETGLDVSAWEIVKSEVVQYLHDPVLQGRIAYHFHQLDSVVRLCDLYLNYAAGIGAALGGSEKTRDALRTHLLKMAAHLDTSATEIIAQIETLEKRLA